ncbi:MAG: hypothetical protein RL531_2110, partial [Actinomycetota bacterium]
MWNDEAPRSPAARILAAGLVAGLLAACGPGTADSGSAGVRVVAA